MVKELGCIYKFALEQSYTIGASIGIVRFSIGLKVEGAEELERWVRKRKS